MGVKTNLAAITFTGGGLAKATAVGVDMVDMMAGINLTISELQAKLNFLITDVLTPAGSEGSNITTINTQLTSLS
jgi:hypothetical protein